MIEGFTFERIWMQSREMKYECWNGYRWIEVMVEENLESYGPNIKLATKSVCLAIVDKHSIILSFR